MGLWPVEGHDQAVRLLQRSIDTARLSHAYLFSGPAHVGKRTLALTFARALCCTGIVKPCGECRACRLIEAGRYHDVTMVADAESGESAPSTKKRRSSTITRSIGIEEVRELQHSASLKPYEAPYKVFIVPNAERLTPAAANSLLKILEEPPRHVIIVLTALDPGLLLPTVVSRCQQLLLRPLPITQVSQVITRRYGLGADAASALAKLSMGCLGWAILAHENPRLFQERQDSIALSLDAAKMTRRQRIELAEKINTAHGGDSLGLQESIALWLDGWRDVLLVALGLDTMVINDAILERARLLASCLSPGEVAAVCRGIEETLRLLRANVNARLAIESLLLLTIPRVDKHAVLR